MAVSFGLFAVRLKGDTGEVTDQFFADTPFIREFASAVAGRLDQPEDSSLDWVEAVDYGEKPIVVEACLSPDEVLRGLAWLEQLAAQGDPTTSELWRRSRQSDPYSREAFLARIAPDVRGMRTLCANAKARGDLVVAVVVP